MNREILTKLADLAIFDRAKIQLLCDDGLIGVVYAPDAEEFIRLIIFLDKEKDLTPESLGTKSKFILSEVHIKGRPLQNFQMSCELLINQITTFKAVVIRDYILMLPESVELDVSKYI